MDDAILARMQRRLRRVERQNHILLGLLCAALVIGSVAATHVAPTVIAADEVRARRFTLLDPHGRVADDWYSDPTSATADNTTRRMAPGYSGWGFHQP
jgi:hypothetical protein